MSAEEILNKHLTYGADTYDAGQRDNILAAMKEYASQVSGGMRWVNCKDRLPEINKADPKHFVFINPTTYQSLFAYNGFIDSWPPLIQTRISDWYWQEVNQRYPVESLTPVSEDKG